MQRLWIINIIYLDKLVHPGICFSSEDSYVFFAIYWQLIMEDLWQAFEYICSHIVVVAFAKPPYVISIFILAISRKRKIIVH